MTLAHRLALVVLVAVLVCPASLTARPPDTLPLVGAMVLGQKSTLDEEDEEPPAEKPKKTTKSDKSNKSTKPSSKNGPAKDTPAKPKKTTGTPSKSKKPSATRGSDNSTPPANREGTRRPPAGQHAEPSRPSSTSQPGTDDERADAQEDSEDDAGEAAEVYDIVFWRKTSDSPPQPMMVMPLREYFGKPLTQVQRAEKLELRRYSQSGKIVHRIVGRQIEEICYYEQRIGNLAAEQVKLLSLGQLAEPGRTIDLTDEVLAEGAKRAEKMLGRALAEHDSAMQRRIRLGTAWNKALREPLVQARVNLRLSTVDLLVKKRNYQQAEAECERVAGEVNRDSAALAGVRRRLEEILEIRARGLLDKQDFAATRELLDQFASRYPDAAGPRIAGIQKALADKASELVRQANAVKQSSPQKAGELYEQAGAIWPALPGLDQLRRQLVASYPILHCAYRELPRTLCPLSARTPVERHAVSLIYESLVRWVDDPKTGSHYECGLAEAQPSSLARGRSFQIAPCRWSDSDDKESHSCTVEDVRWTVKALRSPDCPGYSPVWRSLLKEVDNAEDGSPRQALVRLDRDYWQPLSLMDFKILPAHVLLREGGAGNLPEQLQRLAAHPVGTGPYRLAEEAADTPEMLRFAANPHYRCAGLPYIREIVFYRMEPTQAVDAFQRGKIDMIYGLLLEHVNQLRQHRVRIEAMSTPAVWFLAPNYRRPVMQDENLRLAIAHAIDREAILKQFFRPGDGGAEHVALTGPYPKDSWAYNPSVGGFSSTKAAAFAEAAKKKLGAQTVELQLLYPAGDPAAESACKQIQLQVGSLGIVLKLSAAKPAEFYEQITQSHDFDLAYWRHEYENSAYWLEPLLDANPAAQVSGGPNFMGYAPDADLARLFHDVKLHKCFQDIQKKTHAIHEHVARKAIVIPLWQLSTYVAISERLRDATLDPLAPFHNVEHWKVDSPSH